jgi:hypothetical protein
MCENHSGSDIRGIFEMLWPVERCSGLEKPRCGKEWRLSHYRLTLPILRLRLPSTSSSCHFFHRSNLLSLRMLGLVGKSGPGQIAKCCAYSY